MEQRNMPEYWLRGPLPGIPSLLQPVAHTLLQAREEVNQLMKHFPPGKLWERPAGAASAGFHVQHISGVQDRLLTYARGESLSPQQLDELAAEGRPNGDTPGLRQLLDRFNKQVDASLQQLAKTDPGTLSEIRGVGRAQLPSTVIGLLVHAAEHTMRHTGQLLVTVRVLTKDK
jgi:uncharacterized damage-inducible protein DinB